MSTWELARGDGRIGTGNWAAWGQDLELVYAAAAKWRSLLKGIEKPWLCWNINDDWCKVQQKLILGIGWTPVVGNDTDQKKCTIINGSIYLDFNSELQLPCMWMHFPLEFVFLFCDRLAFWHSDLLCTEKMMKSYGDKFLSLKNGEMAAVKHLHGWFGLKDSFKNRYGELLGCTTRGASLSQFENGCGWWRHIENHPNREKHQIHLPHYEHGKGVWIWKQKFGGKVHTVEVDEKAGHGTVYKRNLPRGKSKSEEMERVNLLTSICDNLDISHLL